MDDKVFCSGVSSAMLLFRAQSLLGMVGNSSPFDSRYDEFRKCVFEAMMTVAKCSEILNDLYNDSENF